MGHTDGRTDDRLVAHPEDGEQTPKRNFHGTPLMRATGIPYGRFLKAIGIWF